MWVVIVAVIAGLIFLGILILSIPFDLAWQLEFYGKPKLRLRWSWLFGLVSREIKTTKRTPRKLQPQKRQPKRWFNISKASQGIRTILDYLRIKGLISQFMKLAGKIFRCLKIRELEADFIVGLDNPADTFYLFAVTEPVNRILDYAQPYPVSIRPSFIEPVFEGYTRGMIRLYPIQLALPVIQFIFSLPVLKVLRKVISARWRRRR